jgi:hypothetical protein
MKTYTFFRTRDNLPRDVIRAVQAENLTDAQKQVPIKYRYNLLTITKNDTISKSI